MQSLTNRKFKDMTNLHKLEETYSHQLATRDTKIATLQKQILKLQEEATDKREGITKLRADNIQLKAARS